MKVALYDNKNHFTINSLYRVIVYLSLCSVPLSVLLVSREGVAMLLVELTGMCNGVLGLEQS